MHQNPREKKLSYLRKSTSHNIEFRELLKNDTTRKKTY